MKFFNVKMTVPLKKTNHVFETTAEGSTVEAATGKAFREMMDNYIKTVIHRRPRKVTLEIEESFEEV